MRIFLSLLILTSLLMANEYKIKKIIPLEKENSFKLNELNAIRYTKEPINIGLKILFKPGFAFRVKGFDRGPTSTVKNITNLLLKKLEKNKDLYFALPDLSRVKNYTQLRSSLYLADQKRVRNKARLVIKFKKLELSLKSFFILKFASFDANIAYSLSGAKKGYDELSIRADFTQASSLEAVYDKLCLLIATELSKQLLKAF